MRRPAGLTRFQSDAAARNRTKARAARTFRASDRQRDRGIESAAQEDDRAFHCAYFAPDTRGGREDCLSCAREGSVEARALPARVARVDGCAEGGAAALAECLLRVRGSCRESGGDFRSRGTTRGPEQSRGGIRRGIFSRAPRADRARIIPTFRPHHARPVLESALEPGKFPGLHRVPERRTVGRRHCAVQQLRGRHVPLRQLRVARSGDRLARLSLRYHDPGIQESVA